MSTMNSTSTSHKKDSKRIYDYIEEEKINQIYENISSDILKNKKYLNDFMKEVPKNVKNQLNFQELRLHSKNKSIEITNDILKNLASKIQKSPESLLINKIEEHRMKKEFVENVLNKSTNAYENRVPITNWMANLRQTQIIDPTKTSYIYYGDVYNPYWVPLKEKKIKEDEVVRNPLSQAKLDIYKYIKNKKLVDSRLNETSNSTNKHSLNSSSFFNHNGNSKNFNCADSFYSINSNLVHNEMMVRKFFKFLFRLVEKVFWNVK